MSSKTLGELMSDAVAAVDALPDYHPMSDDDRADMIAWVRAMNPRGIGVEHSEILHRLCDELEHYVEYSRSYRCTVARLGQRFGTASREHEKTRQPLHELRPPHRVAVDAIPPRGPADAPQGTLSAGARAHLRSAARAACGGSGAATTATLGGEMKSQEWVFTFGGGHPFKDCYIEIHGTSDEARLEMKKWFGDQWSHQYSSRDAAGVDRFKLLQLPGIKA